MGRRALIVWILVVALVLPSALIPVAGAQTPAPAPAPPRAEPTDKEVALSVGSNFFYAPGKFFTCVGGSALWVATMLITFGTLYDEAARMVNEACGGKWTVDDADIREALERGQQN